ncbi:MAG: rod shape-determining protein RodA [Bradyrhizobiaceae bacterium]|nr:rod shape-determining protein RodA [Bradyrhizobiaceae bacterium]
MATPLYFESEDVALKRRVNDLMDWGLLLAVIAVLGIGLISIYSSVATTDSTIFRNQTLYAAIGLTLGFAVFFFPEHWFSDLAYPMYGVGVLALAAVLTPLGHEVNGQRCWIQLGSFTFQPSELAKITTLMAMGKVAARKGFDVATIRDLLWVVGLMIPPVALIMLQPDTGSATVFIAMTAGVLLWMGFDLFVMYLFACIPFVGVAALYAVLFDSLWIFLVVALVASAGAFAFRRNLVVTIVAVVLLIGVGLAVKPAFNKLEQYQQNRLITLFEPERNPRGEGYHVIQSMLAVGSGGLTGKGYLKGTQTQLRYIPEQWTDFIYCVPTEEFGFVGGMLVIVLLASVILRGIQIAGTVRTRFASVVAIGFSTILFYHTLVNIGMAIGLVPVMGIPLPFLSAGGTSLILNLLMVGLLLNFYKTRRRRPGRVAT